MLPAKVLSLPVAFGSDPVRRDAAGDAPGSWLAERPAVPHPSGLHGIGCLLVPDAAGGSLPRSAGARFFRAALMLGNQTGGAKGWKSCNCACRRMSLLRGQEQTVVVAEVDVCPPGHKDQNRRKKGKYMQYRKSWSRRCAVFLSAILLLGLMSTGIVAAPQPMAPGPNGLRLSRPGAALPPVTASGRREAAYTATGTGYDLSMVMAATGESGTVEAEFLGGSRRDPRFAAQRGPSGYSVEERNRPSVSCCKVLGRPAAILRLSKSGSTMTRPTRLSHSP